MKLVLLPGMDGTGALFAPFIREFGSAQVVAYPTTQWSYPELELVARRALPEAEDFVLLGESFSGPLAISIAADPPANLVGLILCCTFAKSPFPLLSPFRHLLPLLPVPPLGLLETLLSGRFRNPELRILLADALATVPARVLKGRLHAVATVDVAAKLRAVRVPVLCLRAKEDRLVPFSALRVLAENAPNAQVVELVAPHFLLQTAPKQAAAAVATFIRERR